MIQARTQNLRVLLYEGQGARALSAVERTSLLTSLLDQGYSVTRLAEAIALAPDDGAPLHMLAPDDGAPLHMLAPDDGAPLVVLGRFEGEARPALEAPGRTVRTAELGDADPERTLSALTALQDELALGEPKAWLPWFPVIDYQRCTNCMQCLSFCLFDVYGVDAAGKIEVRNEEKCKTNCPACSRVCPEVAILFPKYKKGPINGDVVKAEDVQREAMKVDISALLGGDIYASLRDRADAAKKRFSTERDESRALLERKRCLKELGKQLDIPDEVLMTLPSAGEIEERARRAKEKLDARMARSQTERDKRGPATPQEWGI